MIIAANLPSYFPLPVLSYLSASRAALYLFLAFEKPNLENYVGTYLNQPATPAYVSVIAILSIDFTEH